MCQNRYLLHNFSQSDKISLVISRRVIDILSEGGDFIFALLCEIKPGSAWQFLGLG
jgi:hypothetical protein